MEDGLIMEKFKLRDNSMSEAAPTVAFGGVGGGVGMGVIEFFS